MTGEQRRAIFLDRDGTLNQDVGFTHRVEDLKLLPGACDGLRRLQQAGFELVITTNQSGIARGHFSEDQMHAFNAALVGRLSAEGIAIAGVYFCPFHPTEGQGPYRQDSPLRKPNPGMIRQASRELDLDPSVSFAIGDKLADVAAGKAAGCRAILIAGGPAEPHDSRLDVTPDCVVGDLVEAADFIEQNRLGATASGSGSPPRNGL